MDTGARIEKVGRGIARYGLAAVVGGIGALKFTDYEANNIKLLLGASVLTLGESFCRHAAAPFTVDTMPDKTLVAFFEHGEVGEDMPADGDDCDAVLAEFAAAGVDIAALAERLQEEGAQAFEASWKDLCQHLARQRKS